MTENQWWNPSITNTSLTEIFLKLNLRLIQVENKTINIASEAKWTIDTIANITGSINSFCLVYLFHVDIPQISYVLILYLLSECSQSDLWFWLTPMYFPCGSAGVESACNVGDLGSILGLGRSLGEGKGYPLQHSGLENSMNCIVRGVAKSWTRLSDFYIYIYTDGSHILFSVSLFLLTDVHTQLLIGSFWLMIHNHIQLKVLNYIYQQHPSPTFSLLRSLTQRMTFLLSNHLSPKLSYCFHLLHSLWYSAGSQVHKFNLISIAQIHSFILSTLATLLP